MVLPGRSGASLLIRRVAQGTMPPGRRLPAGEITLLRRWVEAFVPWKGGPLQHTGPTPETRAGVDWWSFQPLRTPAPPAAPGPLDPGAMLESRAIDGFVWDRLRRAGLGFSPPASRREFLRRVTYDLHGLPSTPDELADFQRDRNPDAVSRVVDRLLASPRYGERMARRWLDVARFAESDGYEHDLPRPTAWPYRDWVIAAFNRDLGYPDFMAEQIAGDALHPGEPGAFAATGFLVAGGYDEVGAKGASPMMRAEVRQDELEDLVGTSMQAFLGLSAQCARCHDHKFDPIPQRDYYRLAAVFSGARHWEASQKPPVYGVRSETPAATYLLGRGSVSARGAEVTPGALSSLRAVPDRPASLSGSAGDGERRLALAAWLRDTRNPLPARVMTNRVWSWLMGRGIVETPNDFGFNGARPSHPELLDWLAARFAAPGTGGSVKSLCRAIVLSRAYRQSALPAVAGRGMEIDPECGLLWRSRPRRLEAEELRDSLLQIAGKLNLRMGGPGYQLFTWKDNAGALYETRDPDDPEFYRRAIYRMVVRGSEDPLLTSFDCPDPSNTTPRRQRTTTAVQALSLLNNGFTTRMARFFAERVRRDAGPSASLEELVGRTYQQALTRDATPAELARAAAFASRYGLAAWCRVLFNTTEFLMVDG